MTNTNPLPTVADMKTAQMVKCSHPGCRMLFHFIPGKSPSTVCSMHAPRPNPTTDRFPLSDLIGCTQKGCRAQFFMVPGGDFPTLCNDHAEDARRANGTHHAHEEADRLARVARNQA